MVTMTEIGEVNRRNGKAAWLAPVSAAAYRAMVRDGMPTGCVSDAGRTYAEQAQMYADYLAGRLPATAARPGTSKHERGNALDLREPARSWAREHGHRYGWIKDRVANEPWHLEHNGTTDLPAPREEENMPLTDAEIKRIVNGVTAAVKRDLPAAVWRYDMSGGPALSDGTPVPTESAGARLRYIRRYVTDARHVATDVDALTAALGDLRKAIEAAR